MSLADILACLKDVKPCGAGKYMAFCPVHEDPPDGHTRSLSVAVGDDGRVLLHCQAGCKTHAVVAAMGLSMRELFDKPVVEEKRQVSTYAYRTASGEVAFEVVRYSPKSFRQRRPDGNGGFIWNVKGVPRPLPLYRLPELLAPAPAAWAFVVEGEKDANNVAALGLTATCNSGGAGKWGGSDDSPLVGRRVCIIADKDEAGREHAQDAARALHGRAASVRVLELPGDGVKDATDWLDSLDCREPDELRRGLLEMVEAAPEWTSQEPPSGLEVTRLADIAPEPLTWLWPGRIPLGKLTILAGDPNLGKSLLTLELAARISRGAPWQDMPSETNPPGDVLLLSAEDDPADTIRPRLDTAGADVARVHIVTAVRRDDGKRGFFDLGEDLERLERELARLAEPRLLVVDPISAYIGGADDHKNAELRALLAPLADLAARRRLAVLAVTHLRKSGGRAIYAAMGSLAYVAAARAVWLVARDPNDRDRRLLLPAKSNLSPEMSGLAFKVSDGPRVEWQAGAVTLSADEVLAAQTPEDAPALSEAVSFLKAVLASGPQSAKEVTKQAHDAGVSEKSLERAKRWLAVVAIRAGFGKDGRWMWRLPQSGVGGL